MLYVEEVAENEEEYTLILVITAEPDLVLKFMVRECWPVPTPPPLNAALNIVSFNFRGPFNT
jgi:hypothetical protein